MAAGYSGRRTGARPARREVLGTRPRDQRVMTNSSIATGRPLPTTVIVIVCVPTRFHDRSKIVTWGLNLLRRRSTVPTTLPSIATLALPRVGPTGLTQATDFA